MRSVTQTTDWSWNDISGNLRHATATACSGCDRPKFNATREFNRNYNPVVSLDGVNDYVDLPDGFNNFTAGFHNFSVTKFKNNNFYARIFDFGNGADNNNIIFFRQATTNNLGVTVYNGASSPNGQQVVTGGITNDITNLFEFSIDAGTAGTTSFTNIFADSKSLALSGNTTVPTTITRVNNYIGRSNWAADAYNNSDYNEMLFYNVKLSAAERLKVQSYMAVQWALP